MVEKGVVDYDDPVSHPNSEKELEPFFVRFLAWLCGGVHVCACIWKPEVDVRCIPQLFSTLLFFKNLFIY